MIDGDKNKDGKISFEEFVYVSDISEFSTIYVRWPGLLLDKAEKRGLKGADFNTILVF